MEELQSKLKGIIKKDFPIYKCTWFKVGGKADYVYEPYDVDDLKIFLKYKPKNIPVTILGAGSNVLISDNGVKGIVLRLNNFNKIKKLSDTTFLVDSGVMNISMSQYALENKCNDFEFLIGIPGCLGGAVAMNAGCFGNEFKDICVEVKAINFNGDIVKLSKKEIGFGYRKNSLKEKLIFLSTIVKGKKGDKDKILEKMKFIQDQRKESQPKKVKTGGSTFINPEGYKAWELIDKVGLRGFGINGACFSEIHCNFIVNNGKARAIDIQRLIIEAQKRVRNKFGINLQTEIKFLE